MKRLKKGPELKMPELKVPAVPRRPLLRPARPPPAAARWRSRSSRSSPCPSCSAAAPKKKKRRRAGRRARSRAPPAADRPRSFTVVEASPGLRDYRKRLARRIADRPLQAALHRPGAEGAELSPETGDESASSAGEGGSSTARRRNRLDLDDRSGSGGGSPPSGGGGGGGSPSRGPRLLRLGDRREDHEVRRRRVHGRTAGRRPGHRRRRRRRDGRSPVELARSRNPRPPQGPAAAPSCPATRSRSSPTWAAPKHGHPAVPRLQQGQLGLRRSQVRLRRRHLPADRSRARTSRSPSSTAPTKSATRSTS